MDCERLPEKWGETCKIDSVHTVCATERHILSEQCICAFCLLSLFLHENAR